MTDTINNFIADLRLAATSENAPQAVRALMDTKLKHPKAIGHDLPKFDDDEALLFEDGAISIWHCVYHPGASIPPHDHQMPAIIGLYEGRERNDFFEAEPEGGIRKSSEVLLEAGKTLSIGPNAIHAVRCVSDQPCKGFHVYLGALTETDRFLFDVETRTRLPFNPSNYEALKHLS